MGETMNIKQMLIMLLALGFMACSNSKRTVEIEQTPFLEDQLEIDLMGKMNPKRLVASFPNLGLQYLCIVDEEKNIAIFRFDPKMKSKKETMRFLIHEVGVEFVQETMGCQ